MQLRFAREVIFGFEREILSSEKVGLKTRNYERKSQVESFKLRPFVEKIERKIDCLLCKSFIMRFEKAGFDMPFLKKIQLTSI